MELKLIRICNSVLEMCTILVYMSYNFWIADNVYQVLPCLQLLCEVSSLLCYQIQDL